MSEPGSSLGKVRRVNLTDIPRLPKRKKFDSGPAYEIAGSEPTTRQSAMQWASFQRRVNYLDTKVVPAKGGFEIYIRRGARRKAWEQRAKALMAKKKK